MGDRGVAGGAGDEGPPQRRRIHRRRTVVARGLVVLGVLAAILLAVIGWRASGIIKPLLNNWAVAAVAERSDGVYRLDLGRVRLNWLLRRVAVDSVRLTTNVGVNAGRAQPLAEVHVAFDRCTLSGVHLFALVLGRGFVAGSFGCRKGSVAVYAARHAPEAATHPLLVLAPPPSPPASVQRVWIDRVVFPDLALRIRLPDAGRGETRLALERVRWSMADFAIDPTDSVSASRPLYSRVVELAADSFVARPDSFRAARIAHIRASLTDSTLDAGGLAFGPSVPLADFERQGPGRPDVILVSSGRLRAQGMDFGALALGAGVRARRLTVDTLHVRITSDYRGPAIPASHRTPQQWIADLGQTVNVDSIVVHRGDVEYREIRPNQAGPGVLTFTQIEATAAPVRHIDGRQSAGDSMFFVASATLLQAGRLDCRFGVPLDAPGFDMAYAGTLGPMPATAFNQVIEQLDNWKISHGQVEGISFGAAVHHGIARGTLTPRYSNLSVTVTGHGSTGILGAGGLFGGAVRGLASIVARNQINGANPAGSGKAPRRGPIRHVFTSRQTLPAFLWQSLREGLLAVLKA